LPCLQATPLVQAQAMAALLGICMERAGDNPAAPLPLLAIAFVTSRLGAAPSRGSGDAGAGDGDAALQAAYEQLMRRAVAQLQRAGEHGRGRGAQKAAAADALKRATVGAYGLLEALQRVMAPAAYLTGLAALVAAPADRVRRRALALLASRVAAEARGGNVADATWADAALAAAQPAVALLPGGAAPAGGEPATDLTRQAALAALGVLAQALGAQHPRPFLDALPEVLAVAAGHARPAVRASALACSAAAAQALGARLVPILPATARAVVAAAAAAAAAVDSAAAAAPAPEEEGSGSEGEVEESGAGGGAAPSASEATALELAAALAAVSALVGGVGAFLAPHLPHLLPVLLHPSVLAAGAARGGDAAAAIRGALGGAVPARLLLPPLMEHLDAAAGAGADATCALLGMLGGVVARMDSSAVGSYHEAVFACLLRALDLRRRGAADAGAAEADRVEAAAVAAFVELTMRLSEARFTPLFYRLVEWATAAPAGEGDAAAGALARRVALFSLANALAERLRSVFTPYFKALMDPAVEALEGGGASSAAPAKKRRKAAAAEAPAADAQTPLHWTLRIKVRALEELSGEDLKAYLKA
jgi:U3 small nucleolar RNA-associated protein 10